MLDARHRGLRGRSAGRLLPRHGRRVVVELASEQECDDGFAEVERICRSAGTTHVRIAADADERMRIWKGRKAAFAAMGASAPTTSCRTA